MIEEQPPLFKKKHKIKITMEEKDYLKRMKSEVVELLEKVNKIISFTVSDKFNELSEQKQNLLRAQKFAMGAYLNILTERIRVEESE